MTEKTEALRLADLLEERPHDALDFLPVKAAAELRRLHIENEALGLHLSERMKDLAKVEAQRDALLEALKEITPSMPPVDAPCHYGIVPQEKCGHCGRIAKARAAIKAVEEEA